MGYIGRGTCCSGNKIGDAQRTLRGLREFLSSVVSAKANFTGAVLQEFFYLQQNFLVLWKHFVELLKCECCTYYRG